MTERPLSTWTPSPNFKPGRSHPISCIILHSTGGGWEGAVQTLCDPRADNPPARTSAHYLVKKDGGIIHLVHESDTAFHAGYSSFKGQLYVNNFSVGIEQEKLGIDDPDEPFTEAQLASAAALCRAIMADYGIPAEDVVGHADVADGATPEQKAQHLKDHHDPGVAFDWAAFRARLTA